MPPAEIGNFELRYQINEMSRNFTTVYLPKEQFETTLTNLHPLTEYKFQVRVFLLKNYFLVKW